MVAAHPFFPASFSLGNRLLDEADVFDAIEFSHFYTETINFNRRATTIARELGVALVGNSDTHLARQFGTTYSLIEGEPTVPCVLSAIRKGQVRIVSQPLALREMIRMSTELVVGCLQDRTNPTRSAPGCRGGSLCVGSCGSADRQREGARYDARGAPGSPP